MPVTTYRGLGRPVLIVGLLMMLATTACGYFEKVAECHGHIGGDYEGRVLDETQSQLSEIQVRFEQSGCTIQGSLSAYPPVIESGLLSGSVTKHEIEFIVRSNPGGSYVEEKFQGVLHDSGRLSGTFEVPPSARSEVAQKGRWALAPVGAATQ